MHRLSIDVTLKDHQKLEVIVALEVQGIKEFASSRTPGDASVLGDTSEEETLDGLAASLEPRIDQARRGKPSTKSVADIRRAAGARAGR